MDKNDKDWKIYPRYDMKIHFKKISVNEEEQQKAEVRVLNRWFHKNYYDNMHLELTRDGIDGIYGY